MTYIKPLSKNKYWLTVSELKSLSSIDLGNFESPKIEQVLFAEQEFAVIKTNIVSKFLILFTALLYLSNFDDNLY